MSHDQANSNTYRGTSSTHRSLASKLSGTTQAQKARTTAEDDSYKPSRCYPVFWSNDEIRLLELDSSDSGSLLHGSFANVRLGSEQAQYEAVSYTWADVSGDSTRCKPMFIGPFWDIVSITRNCENALRSVRISCNGPPRKIWIDSLCINQDDEKERSAQVALMPRIYAGATGVLVYLGPASEDSDMALDAITHSTDNYEVTLARSLSIFCGSKSAFWPLDRILRHLPVSVWAHMHNRGGDPGWELLGLMTETSQCFCSDPRDGIFALLGMLQRTEERTIAADYSLTSQEVSIGIAPWLVQKCGRGREVLLFAGINRGKRRRLPTWVPDFVEPLKPDWRIHGLLSRSISRSKYSNTAVRVAMERLLQGPSWAPGLGFEPLEDVSIQINPQTSGLHLIAIKLCSLKDSFKSFVEKGIVRPFVRHGSAWRAVVLMPKAPCGSRQSSSWLNIISAEDGLYWLYGIEGFAIMRPNYDGTTHSLVCACDVVFETPPLPSPQKPSAATPGPSPSLIPVPRFDSSPGSDAVLLRRNVLLKRLSGTEEHVCSEHLQRILQPRPNDVGPIQKNDTEAREALLDIAFDLKVSRYRSEVVLWESWQRMERFLRPLPECDKGLRTLRDAFKAVGILPLGNTDDGKPRKLYVLGDCFIESFEAITELLWALLPSKKIPSFQEVQVEPPELSAVEILREFRDWADLTTSLLSAIDRQPGADGKPLSLILPCSEMQQQWRTQRTAFQSLMPQSDPLSAAQDVVSIFALGKNGMGWDADASLQPFVDGAYCRKHRWDWDLTKVRIERQRSFWETVRSDKWLRSRPVLEVQDLLMDGIHKRGDEDPLGAGRTASASERGSNILSDALEVKMAVRLYLGEFGFNLDMRTDVIIR
ncbi:heterokaryon incompatibility protein [Colletotrichum graminicola M1.001]|uniref:Heterokaryon incompatibility protein n=1 Tax=Colletotrichum graminicola (strain M1.001 / M2 / FGSC 10212) TaxID=645133 RepID=E3QV15_COLGM|nr:heterokaryon incompatibility protein [Colletotrichum graminicola M1.001]EFQ34705.1 heterokaryon incompatibility protein [Colletotrichum graminicola M1.001]